MKPIHPKLQVWSCGGGTQSCAIGALIVQGKLPKPDLCIIADPGRETKTTWQYLDGVLNPALKSVGLEVIRVKAEEWSPRWAKISLYDMNRCADVLIPAFSTRDAVVNGKPSKLSNFCTGGWKVEPIESWTSKVLGVTRRNIVKWIGFSRDEQRRVVKMQLGKEYQKGLIYFPLVETVPTTRREAIKIVEDMGWPTPPRSSCWMCPNHSDNEWRRLIAEQPDEFQMAVKLEREMQAVDPDAWLHKSCVPLDQVDFSQPEDLFTRPCDSGLCFV